MKVFCVVVASILTIANGQVSQSEFERGVTANKFPKPTAAQYQGYAKALKDFGISRKLEAAMFLAQILHEARGLTVKREDGCVGRGGCETKYPVAHEWIKECQGNNRPKGIGYYGRGYIQLTWCSNYFAASLALYKDGNKLKLNPESVATDETVAWGVSGWFWKERVKPTLGNSDQFGLTTKAINGQVQECQGNGQNEKNSKQRFDYYVNVFRVFGLTGTPNEKGCNY